jgi:aminoglycoside 3-N-acetyltransferase I
MVRWWSANSAPKIDLKLRAQLVDHSFVLDIAQVNSSQLMNNCRSDLHRPAVYAEPMESHVVVRRLSSVDVTVARRTFAVMVEAFEEEPSFLSDAYLEQLLTRPDFWVISASIDNEVIGGLTAHTLPMTRNESAEVFLYDIAVLERFRRLGAGRMLIDSLRHAATEIGIGIVFVPVEGDDEAALEFYRSLQGTESTVRFFVWD